MVKRKQRQQDKEPKPSKRPRSNDNNKEQNDSITVSSNHNKRLSNKCFVYKSLVPELRIHTLSFLYLWELTTGRGDKNGQYGIDWYHRDSNNYCGNDNEGQSKFIKLCFFYFLDDASRTIYHTPGVMTVNTNQYYRYQQTALYCRPADVCGSITIFDLNRLWRHLNMIKNNEARVDADCARQEPLYKPRVMFNALRKICQSDRCFRMRVVCEDDNPNSILNGFQWERVPRQYRWHLKIIPLDDFDIFTDSLITHVVRNDNVSVHIDIAAHSQPDHILRLVSRYTQDISRIRWHYATMTSRSVYSTMNMMDAIMATKPCAMSCEFLGKDTVQQYLQRTDLKFPWTNMTKFTLVVRGVDLPPQQDLISFVRDMDDEYLKPPHPWRVCTIRYIYPSLEHIQYLIDVLNNILSYSTIDLQLLGTIWCLNRPDVARVLHDLFQLQCLKSVFVGFQTLHHLNAIAPEMVEQEHVQRMKASLDLLKSWGFEPDSKYEPVTRRNNEPPCLHSFCTLIRTNVQ